MQPKQVKKRKINGKVIVRALSFVLGFTLMFVFFGGLVGLVGGFLTKYKIVVNIVAGIIVIIFGLSYVGLFNPPFFKGLKKARKADTVFSAFLFGIVFSVGVGPCTGAFLGSALALASMSGTVVKGVLLLLCYSLGLGIPFVLTALLTDKLKRLFTFIKKHYIVFTVRVKRIGFFIFLRFGNYGHGDLVGGVQRFVFCVCRLNRRSGYRNDYENNRRYRTQNRGQHNAFALVTISGSFADFFRVEQFRFAFGKFFVSFFRQNAF